MLWQIRISNNNDSSNDYLVSSSLEHDEAISFIQTLRNDYPDNAYYITGLYNSDYKETIVKYLEDCHSKSQVKCQALEEVQRLRNVLELRNNLSTQEDNKNIAERNKGV